MTISELREFRETDDSRLFRFFLASTTAIRMSALAKPEIPARGHGWPTAVVDVHEPRHRGDGDARRARGLRPG